MTASIEIPSEIHDQYLGAALDYSAEASRWYTRNGYQAQSITVESDNPNVAQVVRSANDITNTKVRWLVDGKAVGEAVITVTFTTTTGQKQIVKNFLTVRER